MRGARHLARIEEKCMQDFGRKTHGKGAFEDVDAESNVISTQI
jgi:hypothetical protein